MERRPFIAVVDDDESVREALPDLIRELGYEAGTFSSAEEFLLSAEIFDTSCLLLDLSMPGMTGLDLQRELLKRGLEIPIVFITAHGDEAIRRRLRERGAVDCLLKPFSDTALLDALKTALQ
ncbi:MAG TPA: response regulator [Terriglobia bacterium]|nr:response regulator [Terriglobia bacterium]